jgi:hypothetical protein
VRHNAASKSGVGSDFLRVCGSSKNVSILPGSGASSLAKRFAFFRVYTQSFGIDWSAAGRIGIRLSKSQKVPDFQNSD